MFELIFGIIWLSITGTVAYFFIICGAMNEAPYLYPFIGIFIIVGLIILNIGIKKIVANILTSKKGEECIGLIKKVLPTNESINEVPVMKAEVVYFKESDQTIGNASETIGLYPGKYNANDLVKIKVYKDDINFIGKCENVSEVPSYIKEKLDYNENLKSDINNINNMTPVFDSDNPDEVVINGVTYRRVK